MKKILMMIILVVFPAQFYSQIKINPRLFNDPNEEFSIEIPRGFTRLTGEQQTQFQKQHEFLLNKKVDRFSSIYVFHDQERLFIVKLYKNAAPISLDKVRLTMERFALKFNEQMKKFQKPYQIEYENYVIHEKNGRKLYVFYGNGNHYLDNSSFIQAVYNDEYKRSFIIYGFVKKSEKSALDTLFINSILSIRPKEPRAETEESSSINPIRKKWFRYLVLLVVAIAITILYNRYAKQKIMKANMKEQEKAKNEDKGNP